MTILRAFHIAGRPDFKLKPWGSFESWSALVRNSVVWCGLVDPGETRVAIQEQADETARGLRQFIAGLELIDPDRTGKTAAEIVGAVSDENSGYTPAAREMLLNAIDTLIGKPESRKLGNRLRHLRRRVIDGRYIDLAGEDTKRVNRWAVFGAEQFHVRSEPRPQHPPHPPESTSPVNLSEDVGM